MNYLSGSYWKKMRSGTSEITSQGAPTQVSSSVQAEVPIRVETGLTPAASKQASKSTSSMSCEQQGANVARTKTELGDVNASTPSKMHTKGDSGKAEDGAPTLGPPKGVLCDVSLLPCFAPCAFYSHVTFQSVDGQHLRFFKTPTFLFTSTHTDLQKCTFYVHSSAGSVHQAANQDPTIQRFYNTP